MYKVYAPLILREPPSKQFGTGALKKIFCFKIPIHDFHKQDNSFHINSTCCNHRHRCYNYRCCTTMKTEVFASVRNSHRTSQLTVKTHSFLSKCWFTISYEQHRHQYFIGIIQIFKQLRIFWFCWSVCDLYRPRVPHDFIHN